MLKRKKKLTRKEKNKLGIEGVLIENRRHLENLRKKKFQKINKEINLI